ncbi:MAG: hypothetical protein PHG54_02215 [Smithellaceae bacterium]|nr:hypothetical protein [Syntrophaceae bacterium]MDD4240218.1 hypothetical protein [Smithellaceae bacterium]NLX52322.1 hypothetical protein [Deltaproteobacteria bacterium]
MWMIRILASFSNLFFLLGMLAGLYLPQGAPVAYALLFPALTVVLTMTLLRFPGGFFKKPREHLSGFLLGNCMNYLVLGNLVILPGLFLIRGESFWIGLVLIAAVPAAAVILPLGCRMGSDKTLTLSGLAGTYLGALILSPLIGAAFLKYLPIAWDKLAIVMIALIALPLILSRIVVDRNWDERIERWEQGISGVCIFVIFYSLAANSAPFVRQGNREIVIIAVIALAAVIVISFALLLLGRLYKVPRTKILSLLLLGTMKNYGLAGGLALYLFGAEAAVPVLIFSVVMFLNTIWLKFLAGKNPSHAGGDAGPEN